MAIYDLFYIMLYLFISNLFPSNRSLGGSKPRSQGILQLDTCNTLGEDVNTWVSLEIPWLRNLNHQAG